MRKMFFKFQLLHLILLVFWSPTRANWSTQRTKNKEPTKGTDGVLAKDSSNVKSVIEEFSRTQ